MLIILYGDVSNEHHSKQQRMIDGGSTCGYREYAKNYGHIVYMTPQKVCLPWEHSITKVKNVRRFIAQYPDSIVWSVKHSPKKDAEILAKIDNKKLYYSCNAHNRYNKFCDVSLVDTEERIKKNAKLWFKGKDENYWRPSDDDKEFDYLLIGRRGDKNEIHFLKELNKVKDKRKILWIGGKKHKNKISTNHEVICTSFIGQEAVRDKISKAKVGVLFTELKVEGFPQSFLEMTMSGVPVVYNETAPINKFYVHTGNCVLCSKQNLISSAEYLLKNRDPDKCREVAINNYSLNKSYERMLLCLK